MADANGSHVTRAELAAHILRIDERTAHMDARLERIEKRLDTKPAQRWLAGRVTSVVDKALPAVLVGGVVYLTTHF